MKPRNGQIFVGHSAGDSRARYNDCSYPNARDKVWKDYKKNVEGSDNFPLESFEIEEEELAKLSSSEYPADRDYANAITKARKILDKLMRKEKK
jgi:beta-N-acetylglucosaminidase